jgi:alkylation response protein AidB-like acyl-CoA dehydrogenase
VTASANPTASVTAYTDPTPEHAHFRESFRRFVAREVVPHYAEWVRHGRVPRDVYQAAGAAGFMGMDVPEEYGGAGVEDFRFNAILHEEIGRAAVIGFGAGLTLHNDICVPYLLRYANEEQRARWLPGVVTGELLTAIAMSEPGTGSDLGAISTRGKRDAGVFRVRGTKTFISNGLNAELVITAVRTEEAPRHRGLSLLVVESGTPGFKRGRGLSKIGLHAQDTAELFFDDAAVSAENLLGEPGFGFVYLAEGLPKERLSIALAAITAARAAISGTVEYVQSREAFGRTLGSFQNTKFVLADAHTAVTVCQAYVDRCVERINEGSLTPTEAAMAKLYASEIQNRVVDDCLQLHGGYGYVDEYPIARAFVDARVTRIYGGANEIMKEIIGRELGL